MTSEGVGDVHFLLAQGVNSPPFRSAADEMEESTSSKKVSTASGRPVLLSQQSTSLPSTPFQAPRNRPAHSRSPSLGRSTLNASPRSSHSESNNSLPALRRPAGGCKYEAGMAKAKRRVPYSLGPDKLDPESTFPKEQLDTDEDEKLSGDMRELYDRLIPSLESENRRKHLVGKLERLLNERWAGYSIKVNVFGSSGNNLGTNDSDVDICITTDCEELGNVCSLAQLLATHGMERVVCVSSARVPIVKIWDPELQLACDMNVNNPIALENTELIRAYVALDARVRPLAMIIKHWAKRRILNDAALGGTLSSYTWICITINFLQTRDPPILPTLQQQCGLNPKMLGGVNVAFDKNLQSYEGFGLQNKDSVGQLLFQFFRYYGHELDFEENVMSVRLGKILPKMQKGWHRLQDNRLCVEEPFNTKRNLANTADDTSMRGIHFELRRACLLLAEGKLEECCEQYVPPADEGRSSEIFVAPVSKPVVTQAPGQATKGPKNSNRSGRHNNHLNKGQNAGSRRTSNTNTRGSPYLRNLPFQMTPQELQLQQQHQQHLLHDRLFQEYQYLQAQEQQLRAQLHQQAQWQGRIPLTASYPHITFPSYPQQDDNGEEDATSRASSLSRASLSAPIHQQRFPYGSPYLSTILPVQPVSTNPPSPHLNSIPPSTPRYPRRSSVAQSHSAVSLRAHSQPARSVPVSALYPMPMRRNNDNLGLDSILDGRRSSTSGSVEENLDFVSSRAQMPSSGLEAPRRPAEYIGYYVGASPPLSAYTRSAGISPIPSHVGLAIQHGGLSPRAMSLDPRYAFELDRLRQQQASPDVDDVETRRNTSPLGSGSGSTAVNQAPSSLGRGSGNDGDIQNQGEVMTFSASTSEDLTFDTPTSSDGHSQNGVERVISDSDPAFSLIGSDRHSLSLSLEYLKAGGTSTYPDSTRKASSEESDLDGEARTSFVNGPATPSVAIHHKANGVRSNLALESRQTDISLASLKLGEQLSPVQEVRTPSPGLGNRETFQTEGAIQKPSTKAKIDKSKLANAQSLNEENPGLAVKPNGQITPSTTNTTNGGPTQPSNWQMQKKKRRSKKSNKSEIDLDSIDIQGRDSVPIDVTQRKGG